MCAFSGPKGECGTKIALLTIFNPLPYSSASPRTPPLARCASGYECAFGYLYISFYGRFGTGLPTFRRPGKTLGKFRTSRPRLRACWIRRCRARDRAPRYRYASRLRSCCPFRRDEIAAMTAGTADMIMLSALICHESDSTPLYS